MQSIDRPCEAILCCLYFVWTLFELFFYMKSFYETIQRYIAHWPVDVSKVSPVEAEEMLPERIQVTLQFHADLDVMKAHHVGQSGEENRKIGEKACEKIQPEVLA